MTDDPREILKEAGVECVGMNDYFDDGKHYFVLHGGYGLRYIRESNADRAILELARLVAKYKGMLLLLVDEDFGYVPDSVKSDATIADLKRRWEEQD